MRAHAGGGGAEATSSRGKSTGIWGGTKLFPPQISYDTFYWGKVPDKPLRTHHVNLPSIISELSITTMGIFPQRKKLSVLCESKSPGAS
jgi:hypothetical protein